MTKRIAGLTSVILLVLGIAAFTGSALAGNGTGTGKGNAKADTQTASANGSASQAAPGNSANAPGQIKQDTVSTQATGGGSAAQNAGVQAGAKPTSATAKGNKPTMCSTGGGTGSSATCTSSGATAATVQTAAKPDSSKRYGTGTTSAQIANARGAPAGTPVFGPGNSQPHKVLDCKRNHWVDVHAVKSYSTASCSLQSGGTTTRTTGGVGVSASVANTTPSTAGPTTPGNSKAGGVLGATASGGEAGLVGGVLGAIASVGSGVLPFTGFSVWMIVLASIGLVLLGLLLRRGARAIV